ncbi:hypothetical protein ECANGB1_861 [Enterospora canceri]|uniref:Uncharacterized protein n=1 Tax=Enterospora canceri TaxID=1081671 RepID=A0A1Y1S794_9MICR|nr:hypothetical protein ECANGB1_861 [Enterospora canceri]
MTDRKPPVKITACDKVDENPFVREYERKESRPVVKEKVKRILKLELLQRKIVKANPKKTQKRKSGIVEDVKIIAQNEIEFNRDGEIKYYVYPCTIEGTFLSHLASALKCAHDNYKNSLKYFYVKLNRGLIKFEREISCTSDIKRDLIENDIMHHSINGKIVVTDTSNMMVDMLSNLRRSRIKECIVLSRDEFEYGSVRIFRVKETKIIRMGETKRYYYETSGIMYLEDIKTEEYEIVNIE